MTFDQPNASKDDVDVDKDDQKFINEFSRLHAKSTAIDGELKKLAVKNLV